MVAGVTTTPYNISKLSEAASLSEVAGYGNDITSGLLFGGILITIFFILLLSFSRKHEALDSLMAASFITWNLSLLLLWGEVINSYLMITFLTMTVLLAFWKFYTRRSSIF